MDTNKPDGGPAFPLERYSSGMSLRDWFAGQSIELATKEVSSMSIADAAKSLGISISEYNADIHFPLLVAKKAYQIADALLKVREL